MATTCPKLPQPGPRPPTRLRPRRALAGLSLLALAGLGALAAFGVPAADAEDAPASAGAPSAANAANAPNTPNTPNTDDAPSGFDHGAHEGLRGDAEPIACVRCHPLDARGALIGRPDHGACFGDCHGPAPTSPQVAPDRRGLCQSCHRPSLWLTSARSRAQRRAAAAVPRGPLSAPEHTLTMSHARHTNPDRDGWQCLSCHPASPDRVPDRAPDRASDQAQPHQRCLSCHRRAPASARADESHADDASTGHAHPIDACDRCHHPRSDVELSGIGGLGDGDGDSAAEPVRPSLQVGLFPADYSHTRHRARGLTSCRGCHSAILASDSNQLPRPQTTQCAPCHDGASAFSTVTPDCRRCHTRRADLERPRPARGRGFSHSAHRERGLDLACASCHPLDRAGQPTASAPDHTPCADAGCHRDDFSSLVPVTCGACHVGIAPTEALYFDPQLPPESEFGARFSHRRHHDLGPLACADCHRQPKRQRERGLPYGHSACSGAGCHQRDGDGDKSGGAGDNSGGDGDPKPSPAPLSDCQACHQRGLIATRHQERQRAPWSVRDRFRHQPHRVDPRTGTPLACESCHQGAAQSDDLADLGSPAKVTCVPCHDGQTAFKLTGHGCPACH